MLQYLVDAVHFVQYELTHGAVGSGHNNSKLISSYTAQHVHRSETRLKQFSHTFEDTVSDSMSVCIINGLEVINVYQDKRHMLGVNALHHKIISTAVEQSCKCIVRGLVAQFFTCSTVFFKYLIISSGNES